MKDKTLVQKIKLGSVFAQISKGIDTEQFEKSSLILIDFVTTLSMSAYIIYLVMMPLICIKVKPWVVFIKYKHHLFPDFRVGRQIKDKVQKTASVI